MIAAAKNAPSMAGLDLARVVSTQQPYAWEQTEWELGQGFGKLDKPRFHVVAYDFGVKRNILRMLAERGCKLTVVPAQTSAEEALALDSAAEVRAMVDFITSHPNIGAAVSFHTHSGVILRPFGTQSDDEMIPEDLWTFRRFSALGQQLSGYPAISVFHDFKYHPKEEVTGTQDWVYEHLGALFWTVELWAPNREAGIEGYQWIDWYRDHLPEDDLKPYW